MAALLIAVADTGEDPFVGCYALDATSPPVIRIQRSQDEWTASLRDVRRWSASGALRAGREAEVARLFGDDAANVLRAAVGHKAPFGVFKVIPGKHYAGVLAQTPYLAFIRLSLVNVHKQTCSDDD